MTFFASKTLTAYFVDFFLLSGTAIFNVTIARLNKTSLVSFHVKEEERKVEILVLIMFLSRRKQSEDKYQIGRGLLRDNCPAIYTT